MFVPSHQVKVVNNQLTATNVNQTQGYTEDDLTVALDDIVVSDADPIETITATLTLTNPTFGALTTGSGNGETYTAGSGEWTITGSVTQVNAALAAVAFTPATDNDQNTTVAVDIRDGLEDSATPVTGTINLNVTAVNDAPVLASIGNQSVDELATLNFTASATDADLPANNLTFSLDATSIAAGMSIDASTGAFTWTPAEGQDGAHSVTVTVTDDGAGTLSDSETFSITVNEVNVDPILNAIGNQSVDELATLNFTASATDADLPANNLTFSLDATSIAAGMSIDANTGAFTWTPTEGQDGAHSVTVTVTDDGAGTLSDSETFSIIVTPINNNAPVITNPAVVSVPENTTTVHQIAVTDADQPGDSFTYSINNTGADDAHFQVDTSGNLSFKVAPDYETPGDADGDNDYVVDVAVNDGVNTTVQTITVTVTDANEAPTAADDHYDLAKNSSLSIFDNGIIGNDTDREMDPLSAVLVDGPVNGTLQLNSDGSFSYTPNANFQGTDSFTYKTSDGPLESNIATVNLAVGPEIDSDRTVDYELSVDRNQSLSIDVIELLVNDGIDTCL